MEDETSPSNCGAVVSVRGSVVEDRNRTFHRLRQNGMDEELLDVISGFEALVGARQQP
jgi:hypothetical protein